MPHLDRPPAGRFIRSRCASGAPVRAGPAREGRASGRPRCHHAPSRPKRGHAPHGAFRLQGKLAQSADGTHSCASGPRPRRPRQRPSPVPSCTQPAEAGTRASRRVSLARQARTKRRWHPPLCERAPPAKAASAAVPVSVMHQASRSRDTRLTARFACKASSHKAPMAPTPVRAGPAREGRVSGRPRRKMADARGRGTAPRPCMPA